MELEQRKQIRQWIMDTLVTLNKVDLYDRLEVTYENSFTRRMGDAWVSRDKTQLRVRFSIPLWALATEAQRKETVVHEVCHIVDMMDNGHRIYGAHGISWGMLMRKCGLAPNRCHTVERPQELKRNVQRFEAKCSCKTFRITTHRRTKMLKGYTYRCPSCYTNLVLV